MTTPRFLILLAVALVAAATNSKRLGRLAGWLASREHDRRTP